MGKAVQKAEKAADKAEKAQAKIPTKKVIKRELITDNSNGKIKVKLHFEDTEKKPPSQLKVTDAPAAAVRRQIRREIRESEDDNVGVEVAGSALDSAEGTGHLLQEAHHSAQLQPYRAAARAEKSFPAVPGRIGRFFPPSPGRRDQNKRSPARKAQGARRCRGALNDERLLIQEPFQR